MNNQDAYIANEVFKLIAGRYASDFEAKGLPVNKETVAAFVAANWAQIKTELVAVFDKAVEITA